VNSDHLPLKVELSTEEERTQEEERKVAGKEEREVIVWEQYKNIGKRRRN